MAQYSLASPEGYPGQQGHGASYHPAGVVRGDAAAGTGEGAPAPRSNFNAPGAGWATGRSTPGAVIRKPPAGTNSSPSEWRRAMATSGDIRGYCSVVALTQIER